jgi:hypothetical protein
MRNPIRSSLAQDSNLLSEPGTLGTNRPLQVTRAAWREVAMQAGVPFVEVEVICSNAAEHRARIETRVTDIVGLRLPTWDDVVYRLYEPWDNAHLVIDSAGHGVEQSVAALQRALTRRD